MTLKNNHSPNPFKKVAIIMMVLIYALGAVEFKVIHEAFHSEDHSEAQEKNPCHRSLYHQANNSCDHAFHFSQQKQCLLCHLVTNADQWIAPESISSFVDFSSKHFVFTTYHFSTEYFLFTDGRAPPCKA